MNIDELLKYMVSYNASDLHLSSGVAPKVRVDNDFKTVDSIIAPLEEAEIRSMLAVILPEKYRKALDTRLDIDLSFERSDLNARFRVNIFHQNRGISVAMRYISLTPPTLSDLGVPKVFYELCDMENGLI